MSHKKTILIFGISSFVGSSLAEIMRSDYRIIGTYYKNSVEIPGVLTLKCDVLEKDKVERLIHIFKPDITIYSVGLTNLMTCQEFPKLADAINTAGVFNVSQASERNHSKLIFLSSSYVFSGDDVEHSEGDSPTPSTVYGKTKASAEFYIQKSCLNYIIFRCAPLFGHGINKNDPKFVEVLEREAFHKRRIACDNRIQTGFVDVFSLAKVIHQALTMQITNRLIHVSSKSVMTHYEFAKIFLKRSSADVSLISSGDWDFPVAHASSSDGTFQFKMDISNLSQELNIEIGDVPEMIDLYLEKMSGDSI